MQTHLLKLEPPYRFIFDEKYGRTGKVIAVLLKETDDPEDPEYGRTVSVPIVDLAYTWDGTDLADCTVLCDEFAPRISFERFISCLMTVPKSMWFPNGLFSVYSFGSQLTDLGIRVLFPCEGETEGQFDVTMKTDLHLGIDKGEYWVENSFGGFFFNGRYQSREALRSAILTRRNDYYRAFPRKTFRIRLMTDNADFKDLVEEINNTPYERDE
jgi:hypothetical protein